MCEPSYISVVTGCPPELMAKILAGTETVNTVCAWDNDNATLS